MITCPHCEHTHEVTGDAFCDNCKGKRDVEDKETLKEVE